LRQGSTDEHGTRFQHCGSGYGGRDRPRGEIVRERYRRKNEKNFFEKFCRNMPLGVYAPALINSDANIFTL